MKSFIFKSSFLTLLFIFLNNCNGQYTTIEAPQYAALIRPDYYNHSSLSLDEDSNMRWWINLKNRIPRFTMYLEWLQFNSFRPQYRQYREGIWMLGIYFLAFFDFMILLSSLLLFFKIYFLGKPGYRIDLSAPLSISKSKKVRTIDSFISPLVLLAIFALMWYVGGVLTSYGNIAVWLGVRQAVDLAKAESNYMNQNVRNIRDNLIFVNSTWNYIGNDGPTELNLDSSYIYERLVGYAMDVDFRVKEIIMPTMTFEIIRFIWVWSQILISLFVVMFALCGYLPCRCLGVVVAASIVVIGILAEISALLAFSSSEIMMISDVCEQAYKISNENTIPYGETGIGYFMVPISAELTGVLQLYTLKAGKTFDYAMNSFNKELISLNYKEFPANTAQDVQNLLLKDAYTYEGQLKQKASIIQSLDSTIRQMNDIRNNRHLRKFANDGLDKLCLSALLKCGYAYIGIGLLTFSTICIVMICIHLSKLRKMPKMQAATRMIGIYKKIQKLKNASS